MEDKRVLLTQLSLEELISKISSELRPFLENKKPSNADSDIKEILTREQVSELLQVTKVTISQWDKKGILKPYRIGTRIRYKKEDILESLKKKNNE